MIGYRYINTVQSNGKQIDYLRNVEKIIHDKQIHIASLVAQSRQRSVNNQHWLSQWEPSIFDTPQNRRPLTQKNFARVTMSTTTTPIPNLVHISPWGGLVDNWVTYSTYFIV